MTVQATRKTIKVRLKAGVEARGRSELYCPECGAACELDQEIAHRTARPEAFPFGRVYVRAQPACPLTPPPLEPRTWSTDQEGRPVLVPKATPGGR